MRERLVVPVHNGVFVIRFDLPLVLVVNRNGADIVPKVVVSETDVLSAAHVSQVIPVPNSVNVPLYTSAV